MPAKEYILQAAKKMKSIHFKIPFVFFMLLLLSLQLIGAYFIQQLEAEMLASFDEQVQVQTNYLMDAIQPILENDNLSEVERNQQLNETIRRFNNAILNEIQILDEDGFLMATGNPTMLSAIGRRSTSPEVEQALLSGGTQEKVYFDPNQNIRAKTFITPVTSRQSSGENIGLMVVDVNLETVYSQVQNIVTIFVTSSAVSLAFATVLSILVSTGITRPLQEMRDQAEKIAEGNYTGEVVVHAKDEIGELAETINYLSVRVKEAQETTESERKRLDSVLKHMTDGVIATDRRGKVIIINNRALEFLDMVQEEAIGQAVIEILNLKDRYTNRDLFDLPEAIYLNIDQVDEGESIIKAEVSAIQRESGFVSGLVVVLTDVTEHEKIEQDRRLFVSNVSHELRTPLTSVRSYSEALMEGAMSDPELSKSFLQVIQTETDRMIRMITNLLNLSRMDSDQLELNVEFVLFNDLINHILDRFDFMLKSEDYQDTNIRIVREFTDETVWVEIDTDRITQVVDNIMNNAIKYSPDGGDIYVRLMTTHNEVVLSIQDQGLGLPQKAIPHVFERFYRVDKARSRAQGGTGLGLAIAKEVVELHHGRIWVNSIEDKGSTFFIALPYEASMGEETWEI
ncbi:PAS domain-containing sensor histidine kinase [Aerococcus urinaehominis]|uniref:histidine kinase n=1 Tax=Aerococcus urinaehominis TaxID=128944 RepID=A0A0X8FLH5_9LACT|nr:cell wall metabolism sensor histidine kinase WalK [Aerococcus urinaehominis]AMB99511.1 PAS domain-containing sensor histidine kinase [Aerococcus urinaehominis]SDM25887.1 PAS/PAC sensor signal transduction histidine kinase [Aerococcus urinaehominis]